MTSEIKPVAWYYERGTDVGLSFAPDRDPTKPWTTLYTADALAAARNAALEEAIQVCEELHGASPMTLAREILALKEQKC